MLVGSFKLPSQETAVTTFKTSFKPNFATTEPSVSLPIITRGIDIDGKPIIFLQWFGSCHYGFEIFDEEKDRAEQAFGEAQFRFPVHSDPNEVQWMGHPERFTVVSIVQIKDWPNQEAAKAFGDPEEWILYVASTFYRFADGPACYVVPLRVFLADPLYGIITPKKYVGAFPPE